MFELVEDTVVQGARIKVIGVGGAGGNALNTMIEKWDFQSMGSLAKGGGVDFIAANTDMQALKANRANIRFQLGAELTKGLGAGADPEIGRKAALESEADLIKMLQGTDMVFITAGMGGGTGTGAAPAVARVAKDLGILTIGVVTKPFHFEGKRRSRFAQEGLDLLQESVDSLITIPNERLLTVAGKNMPLVEAFKMADGVLLQAVRGIADLILVEGLINLDFADIQTIMEQKGKTLMGSGLASGEHRAIEAATRAISSPLLENVSIRGATGILMNVTGGQELTLFEVNEAAKLVQEEAHEDANIIFGSVIDPTLGDAVRVTVIATGFESATSKRSSEFVAYQRPSLVTPLPIRPQEDTSMEMASAVEEESEPVRPRIPLQSNLKKLMGDLRRQDYTSQEPDADEYDVPTFLRKHAD